MSQLEVFWRPGCAYCIALRRTLRRYDVPATWRNIWSDDEARETVRAVNRGDETVPTVRVGATTVTNPSWRELAPLLGRTGDQHDRRPAGPASSAARRMTFRPEGTTPLGDVDPREHRRQR